MDQETQTAVDIQGLVSLFPVWDEEVWSPLQKKQFPEAQRKLELLLESFEPKEWSSVYWGGLFRGVPAVRGALSQKDWDTNVKPLLTKIILNLATGKILSGLYQNLTFQEQLELTGLIFDSLPGKTGQEKINWLKENKISIFVFLTASLAQDLGINPENQPNIEIAKRAATKYGSLPLALKIALFDFNRAESLFRICRENHLSEEKISLLAGVCGRVLMGLIHIEDISREIQSCLLTDQRLTDELNREIRNKIIIGLENDIKEAYEPITDVLEREKAASGVRLDEFNTDRVAFQTQESTEPRISITETDKSQAGAPLIIHREETETLEKRPTFRGFSFPGFFRNRRTEPAEEESVKVKIETPKEATGGLLSKFSLRKDISELGEPKRVVHYSEFRTPITPFSDDKNFLSPEGDSNSTETKPFTFAKPNSPETPIAPPKTEMPVPPLTKPAATPTQTKPDAENKTSESKKGTLALEQIISAQEKTISKPAEESKKSFLWFNQNKPKPQSTTVPPNKSTGQLPKNQPTVEGNVVDLRNKV